MKAKVNFDGRWLSEIDVDSYKYPVNERIKRSLKTFFIFFGAALLSVLIPVLHFFLVPVFLILSVLFSYRKFKEIHSVDLSNLSCPDCKIKLNSGKMGLKVDDLTVRLSCDGCRKTLTIVFEEKI